MKLPDQCNWDGAANLRLEVDENEEDLHDLEPEGAEVFGEEVEEERDEYEEYELRAESGAEEEANEGSESELGDWDFLDDESYETSSESGRETAELEQEEQPLRADVQCPPAADSMQEARVASFTEEQVQELEHIFQLTGYPCRLLRINSIVISDWAKIMPQTHLEWSEYEVGVLEVVPSSQEGPAIVNGPEYVTIAGGLEAMGSAMKTSSPI
ncbi:rhox homeobox family member 2-like [Saccopteryx leptura]|uniref:rhox homeobox family member 2-like n=1 Tax=Saccopteryx leptura TaxID=249018 RepID=UPI00339C5969